MVESSSQGWNPFILGQQCHIWRKNSRQNYRHNAFKPIIKSLLYFFNFNEIFLQNILFWKTREIAAGVWKFNGSFWIFIHLQFSQDVFCKTCDFEKLVKSQILEIQCKSHYKVVFFKNNFLFWKTHELCFYNFQRIILLQNF